MEKSSRRVSQDQRQKRAISQGHGKTHGKTYLRHPKGIAVGRTGIHYGTFMELECTVTIPNFT
jgi:hypothetical protein